MKSVERPAFSLLFNAATFSTIGLVLGRIATLAELRHIHLEARVTPRNCSASFADLNLAVGVVSGFGAKHLPLASAFVRTWGAGVPQKMVFLPGEVNSSSIADPAVLTIASNAFEGVDMSQISLNVSKISERDSDAWKVAQHMYLEAANRLSTKYPAAAWYMLLDADTHVDLACLSRLLTAIDSQEASIYMGDGHSGDWVSEPVEGLWYFGGAGVIWSSRAAKDVDFPFCIRSTLRTGPWQGLNSELRMVRCFKHFDVRLVPVLGMYQEKITQVPWYARLHAGKTPGCIISQHRLLPEDLYAKCSVSNISST